MEENQGVGLTLHLRFQHPIKDEVNNLICKEKESRYNSILQVV
jgi:hypothetical protein